MENKTYYDKLPLSFQITVKDIVLFSCLIYNIYNSHLQRMLLEEKLNNYKDAIVNQKKNIIEEFDKKSTTIIDRVSKIEDFIFDKLDKKSEHTNNVIKLMSEKANNKITNYNLDELFKLGSQEQSPLNSAWNTLIEWLPAIIGTILIIWLVYSGYNRYNDIVNTFYPYVNPDNYVKEANRWVDFFNRKGGNGNDNNTGFDGKSTDNSLTKNSEVEEFPVVGIFGSGESKDSVTPENMTALGIDFDKIMPLKPPVDVQNRIKSLNPEDNLFSNLSEQARKEREEAFDLLDFMRNGTGDKIVDSTSAAAEQTGSLSETISDLL